MMVRLSKGPAMTIMEPATIETESKKEKIGEIRPLSNRNLVAIQEMQV